MRAACIPRGKDAPRTKPEGGYQLIPTVQLALAWRAYRDQLIRHADLRAWFAAWEMRARRCRLADPLPRRYGLGELRRLTGLSPRRLKAALRRLEAAGLLRWSDSAVEFPVPAEALARLDGDGFRRLLGAIPNHGRRVPVPRRILRLLAAGCRPALTATILGHLLRCLYLKGGQFQETGRVKASWVAETFGVAPRRVKEARHELVASGWLVPLPSPQWMLNRWGALVRIDLAWSPAAAAGPGLAPPAPVPGTGSAPPESDEEPLQEDKNQEPAAGGPSGSSIDLPEEEAPNIGPPTRGVTAQSVPGPPPGRPDLRRVVPADLADTGRLLELYAQAVAAGLVPASEWGRQRFAAAAEHARSVGKENPCGLFVRLVRGGLLHYATGDDEEAASVRLRRHEHGGPPPVRPAAEQGGTVRRMPNLSEDARLVQAVRVAAVRVRYRGDPFPLLKREKPEWTRERWDRAAGELDSRLEIGMSEASGASRWSG